MLTNSKKLKKHPSLPCKSATSVTGCILSQCHHLSLPFSAWFLHVTVKPEKRRRCQTVKSRDTLVINEQHAADYQACCLHHHDTHDVWTNKRRRAGTSLWFPSSLRRRCTLRGKVQPRQRSVMFVGEHNERCGCTNFSLTHVSNGVPSALSLIPLQLAI